MEKSGSQDVCEEVQGEGVVFFPQNTLNKRWIRGVLHGHTDSTFVRSNTESEWKYVRTK